VAANTAVIPDTGQTQPPKQMVDSTKAVVEEGRGAKPGPSRAALRDDLRRRKESAELPANAALPEDEAPEEVADEVGRVRSRRAATRTDTAKTARASSDLANATAAVVDSTLRDTSGVILNQPDSSAVAAALPDSVSSPVADSVSVPVVQKAPPPPKPPEIDWKQPEYFINGIIPVPTTLHTLYSSVASHFGDTPYGKRAAELRKGLEAVRMELAVAELQKARDEANANQAPGALPRKKPADAPAEGTVGAPTEGPVLGPEPAATDSVSVPAPDMVPPDSSRAESLVPAQRRNRQGDP